MDAKDILIGEFYTVVRDGQQEMVKVLAWMPGTMKYICQLVTSGYYVYPYDNADFHLRVWDNVDALEEVCELAKALVRGQVVANAPVVEVAK